MADALRDAAEAQIEQVIQKGHRRRSRRCSICLRETAGLTLPTRASSEFR